MPWKHEAVGSTPAIQTKLKVEKMLITALFVFCIVLYLSGVIGAILFYLNAYDGYEIDANETFLHMMMSLMWPIVLIALVVISVNNLFDREG